MNEYLLSSYYVLSFSKSTEQQCGVRERDLQPVDVGQSGSLCLELPTAVQDTKYQQQQQQQQKKNKAQGKPGL